MTRFMTLDFAEGDRATLLDQVAAMARQPYGYVVTPNVDHVIKLMDGRVAEDVYRGAALMICDSRILAHLARLRGKRLSVYPGSDMTADLLASGHDLTFGVFGPDRAAFDDLVARYPARRFTYIEAPMLTPGSPEWDATVKTACKADWDVLLTCVSFPKQERFAHALRVSGRPFGVALCVGASIDFLTGRQHRAPKVFQQLSLEWLHRLLSQPKRMFRRYVIEGPAIFGWFLKTEVFASPGG
ncbi:MAG: WecB/TagA/CpsF family glycosyltransferase [Brevundimonas sp.]|uniref:WecB/TagA/CpsF family glycosyltransferase n=2 Tax=Brevundimonas sp. TaxID=1871086 RepID=UPI004034A99D